MSPTERRCLGRNLAMLTNPPRWPCYPFLPLRRAKSGQSEPELGVLYDVWGVHGLPGFSATIFFANLLLLPPTVGDFFELPREVFDTPMEIYEAGWRVD